MPSSFSPTTHARLLRRPSRFHRAFDLLVLGSVLALSALQAGCSPGESELGAARSAIAAGDWPQAERMVQRLLQSSPDRAETQLMVVQVGLARNQLAPVFPALEKAASLGADPREINRWKGLALTRVGRLEQAEPLVREALQASRGPEPALAEALARIGYGTYRFGAANEALERWIQDAPSDPQPWRLRLDIDERTQVEDELVIAHAHELLRRAPDDLPALKVVAERSLRLKLIDKAAAAYQAYVEKRPKEPFGHFGLGQTALERGDPDAARRSFETALGLDPGYTPALRALANLEGRTGNPTRSIELLGKAAELDPEDFETRYALALVLQRAGKVEEAQRQRKAAQVIQADQQTINSLRVKLQASPTDPELQFQVARWLIEHGHGKEGVDWAAKVIKAKPEHAPTHGLLAGYYRQSGQLGLANYHKLMAERSSPAEHLKEP